jgi:hypothetical protein
MNIEVHECEDSNNLQTWYSVRYHQNSEVSEHGRQVDNTGQANSSINVSMLTVPETIRMTNFE